MSASGMAASASAPRTSGGSCNGQFRRLQKCSVHHDTTDSRSDSRLPSAAFNGVDGTVLLGLSRRNLVKASLISQLQRHCSPSRAIRLAHCCLSCLSARRRGPARRLYSSTSPIRTAFSPLFYNGHRGLGYPWLICMSARSKNLPCSCI